MCESQTAAFGKKGTDRESFLRLVTLERCERSLSLLANTLAALLEFIRVTGFRTEEQDIY